MNRCAFVIPYFGRFNNYFQLFLDSCAANPDFDWLIFTDDCRPFRYPSNVHVTYCTLQDTVARLQACVDFPIRPIVAYKLCDYRPVYGQAYSRELENYEFWGHCDTDIIWGRLHDFLTDDVFDTNDRILDRGHLILYRNNPQMNQLFKTIDPDLFVDYRDVFRTAYSCHFDEWEQWHPVLEKRGIRWWDAPVAADIVCSDFPFHLVKGNHPMAKQIFEWERGQLWRRYLEGEEVHRDAWCYIHLQKRAMQMNAVDPSHYMIVPNAFVPAVSEEDLPNFIEQHSRPRFYAEWKKRRWKEILTNVRNGALHFRYRKYRYLLKKRQEQKGGKDF